MIRLLPLLLLAASPTPSPAPSAVPIAVTDSTLSFLERDGADCVWHRVDPLAGSDVETWRFPGSCVRVRLAWSPDGEHAAVRIPSSTKPRVTVFDGSDPVLEDAPPRKIVEITLADGSAREVPLPPKGEVRDVGYDDLGLVTLSEWVELPSPLATTWAGLVRKSPPQPVTFLLAQRWSGTEWVTVETQQGPAGDSVVRLAAFQRLGPRTSRPMTHESAVGASERTAAGLEPGSSWMAVRDGAHAAWFPFSAHGNGPAPMFLAHGLARPAKSWPVGRNWLVPSVRGRFLLVGTWSRRARRRGCSISRTTARSGATKIAPSSSGRRRRVRSTRSNDPHTP